MTDEEARLTAFIEHCVGGRVVALERQPRWRKAWYCTVSRQGEAISLYVRGDKQLDAEPYPGLGREAGILRALAAGGLPVPRVHGVCDDPEAIVMDRVPGERDISLAASDDERRRVAFQYIEAMAAMHGLDTGPFEALGISRPATPEDLALAYVNANQPLYERTKPGPEPLLEFALGWLRRNVPRDRTEACFIHGDAGQFLFAEGKLTALHDFEASHIGDPLADLASLRVRQPTEPLGADLDAMLRHYQTITGRAIDGWALSYHTAAFMVTAVMALVGPLKTRGTTLHGEYLVWDLTCRRALLWAMAECMGVAIERCPPTAGEPGRQGLWLEVLGQTLQRLDPGSDGDRLGRHAALMVVDWLRQWDRHGAELARRDNERLAALLGSAPPNWRQGEADLEAFVRTAGPDQDLALLHYFAAQVEADVMLARSLGARLEGYALAPVRL